jgi:hypothetical protein
LSAIQLTGWTCLAVEVGKVTEQAGGGSSVNYHCPATDPAQPPYYCPPLNPKLPNQGQPNDELLACLTHVEVQYYDNSGHLVTGTIVVNRDLASDPKTSIVDIFDKIRDYNTKQLKAGRPFFPITSVLPVNHFGWSDDDSMRADNSSNYNFRLKTGTTDLSNLSMHSFGRAMDVNTMCNPWVKKQDGGTTKIDPPQAVDPATRAPSAPIPDCTITRNTEMGKFVVETFTSHGWQWGGDWTNPKDYQHFQFPSADREKEVKQSPYCGFGVPTTVGSR